MNKMATSSQFKDYVNYVKSIDIRPWEEQKELFIKYADTNDKNIENSLFNQYLPLVVNIATKKFGKVGDAPIMDIIQDGNIGLLKAVRGYDISRNIKFTTYAYTSIVNSIILPLRKMKSPVNVSKVIIHSIETPEQVSWNAPLYDDDDTTLGDTISYENDKSSYDHVYDVQLTRNFNKTIMKFQQDLTLEQRMILHYRILRDDPIDLKDLGWWLGYSREYIRLEQLHIEKLLKCALKFIRDAA